MEELSCGLKGKKVEIALYYWQLLFSVLEERGGLAWTIGTDEVSVI